MRKQSCQNCQTELEDDFQFCPNCGQKNKDINISFRNLLSDFVGDYFSFDSKLFSSLKPLVFQPGKLPENFISGKRIRYIPPLRILIFLSFIYLLIWDVNLNLDSESNQFYVSEKDGTFGMKLTDSDVPESEVVIGSADSLSTDSLDDTFVGVISELSEKNFTAEQIADSLCEEESIFEYLMVKQITKLYQSNFNDFIKYTVGNVSVSILILQPMIGLILFALFRKKRWKNYIAHVVFSIYFHAFLIVLLIVFTLLGSIYSTSLWYLLFTLISLIYLYQSFRSFYQESWGWATVKTSLFTFIYTIAFILFVIILTFISSFFLY